MNFSFQRERCNKLTVCLYPEPQGYTVGASTVDGQTFELARLPYSEDSILNSLDAQEVPTSLSDLLDQSLSGIGHMLIIYEQGKKFAKQQASEFNLSFLCV